VTVWTGSCGHTYFYQCELPYDSPQTGPNGFGDCVGFKVASEIGSVRRDLRHEGVGVGVYCFFRDHVVKARAGVSVDMVNDGSHFVNSFTRFLTGNFGSGIDHVINERGEPV
jgi:hypothetical protein